MPTITEGQLQFDFPDGWQVSKFDDWSFYRTEFMRDLAGTCSHCDGRLRCEECKRVHREGPKGIDILAIQNQVTCWQIEIKDYRSRALPTFEFLADAVAEKVKDTLAALVIANLSAQSDTERVAARKALACAGFRVILHLEQPPTRSRLHPSATRLANVQQRLRELVKCIDREARVTAIGHMQGAAWRVTTV